jgi:hypothetical protein
MAISFLVMDGGLIHNWESGSIWSHQTLSKDRNHKIFFKDRNKK